MNRSKAKASLKRFTLLMYTYASLLSLQYTTVLVAADNQVYWDEDSQNDAKLATAHAEQPALDKRSNLRSSSFEQRRSLSFWSSFMNFLHCPPVPGFHNDENNPHCHHRHHSGGGSHSSSKSGSESHGCGDDGCEQEDETNDDGCGDDGCGTDDGRNDDNAYSGSSAIGAPSASPTAFTDKMSNDVWGWWKGPSDRNQKNSAETDYDAVGGEVMYGLGAIGLGVAGVTVAASLVLRRRNQLSSSSTVSTHPLNGAVAGRKKTFGKLLGKHSKAVPTGHDLSPVTEYVQA